MTNGIAATFDSKARRLLEEFWNSDEENEILSYARQIIKHSGPRGPGWYKFALDANPNELYPELFLKVIYVLVDGSGNAIRIRRFDKGSIQRVTDDSFIFEAGRTDIKKYSLVIPENRL